jgi:peptide/nickel transport system substrate-binding protein
LNVTTAPAGWANIAIHDSNGTIVKALGDVRVRQALNYAIDREAISKSLYEGVAEPTSEDNSTDSFAPSLQNYYPYDPAKAKQLLAEAGYPHGFSFDLVTPNQGTLLGQSLTQAITQDWANIGVTVNFTVTTTESQLFKEFLDGSAFMLEYSPTPTLTYAQAYLPDAFVNPQHVKYQQMVGLINRASVAPQDQQPQLALATQTLAVQQAYDVNIVTMPGILYSTHNVSGVQAEPLLARSPAAVQWAPINTSTYGPTTPPP